MKLTTFVLLIILVVSISFAYKFFVLKETDPRLLYSAKRETFVESIELSGVFHKTASDEQKAAAFASYQNAISMLTTASQNKQTADAAMWTKRQALLAAENEVDYKNDNTTNPSTKNAYTDLEKSIIDSSMTQAEKDFRAAEQKYKEAGIAIAAAQAQVNAAKITYDDTILNEPVVTVDVNEIYAPKISVGQPATIVFDALKNTKLQGKVVSIEPVGTIMSGVVTFETKISVDALPDEIKPNMTAVVTIDTIHRENTIAVPLSSVIYKNSAAYVQKADDAVGSLTEVKLGDKGLTKVEVVSGLDDGEMIVARLES